MNVQVGREVAVRASHALVSVAHASIDARQMLALRDAAIIVVRDVGVHLEVHGAVTEDLVKGLDVLANADLLQAMDAVRDERESGHTISHTNSKIGHVNRQNYKVPRMHDARKMSHSSS
jgi:hypothetical protein